MASTRNRLPDSIKAYTKLGLRVYDGLVMYLLLKHVWGCNPDDLVDHYRRHVKSNHADIGVGTGASASTSTSSNKRFATRAGSISEAERSRSNRTTTAPALSTC